MLFKICFMCVHRYASMHIQSQRRTLGVFFCHLAAWLLVDLTQFRQVRAFWEIVSIRLTCRQERLWDIFAISLSSLPRGWSWTAGDPLPRHPQCQDSRCVPPHSAPCRHLSLCHHVLWSRSPSCSCAYSHSFTEELWSFPRLSLSRNPWPSGGLLTPGLIPASS